MVPLVLHSVGAGPVPCRGALTFRRPGGEDLIVAGIPLGQARILSAELGGLNGDCCATYHLVQAVAQALDAEIVGLILREGESGGICGALRLKSGGGLRDLPVDIPAAVATALHLRLPMFWDGPKVNSSYGSVREIPEAFRAVFGGLKDPPDEGLTTTEVSK